MSLFLIEGEVKRVEFPDGQWVEIREELTQAEAEYINEDASKGKVRLFEKSVKAWSFPIPVSWDNFDKLRMKYRAGILKAMDTVYEEAMGFPN